MPPTLPSQPVAASSDTDIYSITDAHLAQRYQFIREIGAGNWGCVWLCAPKTDESHGQAVVDDPRRRVAVKLVFREKKPTTAQRVRSLWNEMKIVRALKQDPHPSIIPFHSFIITPSFAIITMEYLPHLVPVEVPECKAREWFRSLLSAVSFLHDRGVVHNDIKPANILLSTKNVPVFVDFGFAERYEIGSKRAFLSNLAYGTPEYLSPERARGNVHDTRKSDMWSLGIAFFEILIGRTPFEYVEGEKFTTPEDLERYWSRTVKGKWVGEWKMSKPAERLLLRMISPNADIRYTASQAMGDVYWSDESDAEVLSDAQEESSVPASVRTPCKVKGVERKTSTPLNRENIRTPASTPKRIPAADGMLIQRRRTSG
ncbi:kinase-like protein [Phellopilus nigrolimitatus]|nr:kinase-like protein [Phellopilus nigrolimitatus]